MLERCAAFAAGKATAAVSQQEANVCRVAGMIVGSRFREESRRLLAAGDRYFQTHPHELVEPGEVVRRGWIVSFPRLREGLYRQFEGMST